MAEVRDGDQPPHTESDPASTVATASIFETEAPGTAPSDGTMLVASDSFENIYEPIEAIRPRLGSGIIDSMSGKKKGKDEEEEEEEEEENVLYDEKEEEEEEENVVLYDEKEEEGNVLYDEKEEEGNVVLYKKEEEENVLYKKEEEGNVVLYDEKEEEENVVLYAEKEEEGKVVLYDEKEEEEENVVLYDEKEEEENVVLYDEKEEEENVLYDEKEEEEGNVLYDEKEEKEEENVVLYDEKEEEENVLYDEKEEEEGNVLYDEKEEKEEENVVLYDEKEEEGNVVLYDEKEEEEENVVLYKKEEEEENVVLYKKEEVNVVLYEKEEEEEKNVLYKKDEEEEKNVLYKKDEEEEKNVVLYEEDVKNVVLYEEDVKNVVLYEKDDEEEEKEEKDNKLREDLRGGDYQGLNNEVKDERISKGAGEKEEGKEEKLMRMDEKEVEKNEIGKKVEGDEEEETNKPSNDDVVITTSTPSPPPTECLGTDPGSGTNIIITHSTDSMSTSTASASTPGGDSGGSALSSAKKEEDDEETRRGSVLSAELASSVEGLAVSVDDTEGDETSSWMHTSTNTLSDGEDVMHPAWRNHKKHVFILSEAGKPVYSRFGNEDNLVTLMGLMQALVSFVSNSETDIVRCIVAGSHRFVFLIREHLILVGISQGPDSAHQLLLQLSYVYNQIISVLTLSQLGKIFRQRRNFDLRRLLSGAEKFIDNLLNMMDSEPGFLLGAVRCLPLDGSIRDSIAQTICQHCKVKDLVFALIIASSQLVTLVRMKKYYLHPVDLHLIINLVNASESFKAAESWTPICLPKFDSSGFLQAHVSYLDESCQTCLFLLTVDRDSFFTLSECKSKIKQKLQKSNSLQAISDSLSRNSYSIKQCAISGLRHFLYKSRNSAQYTSPELEAPYLIQEEQERLFGLYQYLHHRIHSGCRPLKLLYHVGPHETLIGWITQGFELYAVFGPLVTKTIAIQAINKLLRWIKKEENRLFILSSFTF